MSASAEPTQMEGLFIHNIQGCPVIYCRPRFHAITGWRVGRTFARDALTKAPGNRPATAFFGVCQSIQDGAALPLEQLELACSRLAVLFLDVS